MHLVPKSRRHELLLEVAEHRARQDEFNLRMGFVRADMNDTDVIYVLRDLAGRLDGSEGDDDRLVSMMVTALGLLEAREDRASVSVTSGEAA